MNFALEMMNSAFKMMNFVGETAPGHGSADALAAVFHTKMMIFR